MHHTATEQRSTRQLVRWAMPLLLAVATTAHAGAVNVVVPEFDTFGSLPGATFGGTGIPNDAVAISTFSGGGLDITLGLTATPRFANPALINNGAGVFIARPGVNDGTPGSTAGLLGATWNFGFYVETNRALDDFNLDILYDFDPATGTEEAALGRIRLDEAIAATGTDPGSLSVAQGSQNLLFGFLAVPAPPVLFPPAGSFDPLAEGEYAFGLRATSVFTGDEFARTSILVQVVPEPPMVGLLLWPLLLLGAVVRWRRGVLRGA